MASKITNLRKSVTVKRYFEILRPKSVEIEDTVCEKSTMKSLNWQMFIEKQTHAKL